jgi:hypothetical protein
MTDHNNVSLSPVLDQHPELFEKALGLYTPPFRHVSGYIYDAKHRMVSDAGGATEMIQRVRGWGRIQYLMDADPELLQDAVGELVARALTQYWEPYAQMLSERELLAGWPAGTHLGEFRYDGKQTAVWNGERWLALKSQVIDGNC